MKFLFYDKPRQRLSTLGFRGLGLSLLIGAFFALLAPKLSATDSLPDLTATSVIPSANLDPYQTDEQFLKLFNSSQYQAALTLLENHTQANPEMILEKPTLLNFALAYWRVGLPQNALAFLVEAKLRYPLDPSVRQFLAFVQQEQPQLLLGLAGSALPWSFNWSLFGLSLISVIFSLVFLIRQFISLKSPHLKNSSFTLINKLHYGFALLFFLGLGISSYQLALQWNWQTVNTEPNTQLKTRPNESAPSLAQISDGQWVRVLKQETISTPALPSAPTLTESQTWVLVELQSGIRGWVPLSALFLLEKHPLLFEHSPQQRYIALLRWASLNSNSSEPTALESQ